jgi:hypothetical protein
MRIPKKLRDWYVNALMWLYIGLNDEEKQMFILLNKREAITEAKGLIDLSDYFTQNKS